MANNFGSPPASLRQAPSQHVFQFGRNTMTVPGNTLIVDGETYNINDIKKMKVVGSTAEDGAGGKIQKLESEVHRLKHEIKVLKETNAELTKLNHYHEEMLLVTKNAYQHANATIDKRDAEMRAKGH